MISLRTGAVNVNARLHADLHAGLFDGDERTYWPLPADHIGYVPWQAAACS